jgi:Coenzyme PQQ synthesis protein D (PqqD)
MSSTKREVPLTAHGEIPDGVLFQKVADEMVILSLNNGIYFGLDPVGTRMWELLAAGKTLAELAEAMTEEYDIGRELVASDAQRLVAELADHGLMRIV